MTLYISLSGKSLKSPVSITFLSGKSAFALSTMSFAPSTRALGPLWSVCVEKWANSSPVRLLRSSAQEHILTHAASQPLPGLPGVSDSQK